MENISKRPAVNIMLSCVTGILAGYFIPGIRNVSMNLITPLLILMLTAVFMACPFGQLKSAFKNYHFSITSILMNFVWTPLLAYILGKAMLSSSPELWLGFIMLMVTPCTDWYLIFTGLAKGNTALATSILPLNLILQLALLPVYVIILGGSFIYINSVSIFINAVFILATPLVLSYLIKKIFIIKRGEEKFKKNIVPNLDKTSQIMLNLAVIAMFSYQGEYIIENPSIFLVVLIPVLCFFIINFVLSVIAGRVMKFSYKDNVALTMTTLARNSPLALAVAAASVPDKPLVSLILVIGPLIEIPVLSVVANALLLLNKKRII